MGIAAPRDEHRKPIGGPIASEQQIRPGLAGGIGTPGVQRIVFL